MPRSISVSMNSAVSAKSTRPGYFIEIEGVTATYRWCTRSDTSWNGQVWAGQDISITGVGSSGNGTSEPTLNIKDMSGAATVLALSGEFKDANVRIWNMDAGATDTNDPVFVFSGSVNSVKGDVPNNALTITLAIAKASALFSPRMTYGPGIGMNTTIPRGTILRIGNKEYKVERR